VSAVLELRRMTGAHVLVHIHHRRSAMVGDRPARRTTRKAPAKATNGAAERPQAFVLTVLRPS
jgi:hypothetical protein